MITLNDSQLFTILRKILIDGFAAGGFTDKLEVTQKYQPELGGMPLVPTIYMYKLTGSNYGFSSTKAKLNVDDFTGITSQMKTPMFQVSALAQVDPEEENPLFPTDYVEFAAAIINMPSTIAKLKLSGIGVERVREIREGYFLDDKDLYEQTPSFDFTISYQKEYLSKIPKADHIEGDILLIKPDYTPPSPITRYFRRNLGTIDYASLDSGVVLDSDFSISGIVLPYGIGFYQIISGASTTFNIRSIASGGACILGINDISYEFTPTFVRGSFNEFIITRAGSMVTVDINGVSQSRRLPVSSFNIMRFYRNTDLGANSPLQGILANLKVSSDGAPIHSWEIGDNGNTLADSVGGNNATLVNPNPDDWGLFTDHPTLWKGKDLAVPPWDSVDQKLLKA